MNPPIEGLEDWLAATLPESKRECLLDVGSYRGDFSLACAERGLCKSAHLFEPNPDNQIYLESIVRAQPGFALHKIALGSQQGKVNFQCTNDGATGSILPYRNVANTDLKSFEIEQRRLDDWWQSMGKPTVSLCKIDTQGNDHRVLLGAPELIRQERPWLVLEFIFAPLYYNQSTASDLLSWAEAANYSLGGFFNDHFTTTGNIAFSDAVLVPREHLVTEYDKFLPRPSPQALQKEVEQLREICAERLSLIEYLHDEAQNRQIRINELTQQLQRSSEN